MKLNVNFLQTGGVPLTNDLMASIMEAVKFYDVIGDLAGNLTIVSGCDFVSGSTTVVNPGVVAINGELLPFEGGSIFATVFVYTEDVFKTFEDQNSKVLVQKKTVKFGNASTSYNWADFEVLPKLKTLNTILSRIEVLEKKTAPIINGGIVLPWRKPADKIPDGWKECTDIRGKTIVGLDPNDNMFKNLGASVGTKTHTLSIEELPEHDHGVLEYAGAGSPATNKRLNASVTGQFSSSKTTSTGSGNPHNNVQPSHIAYYIEPNFQ